MGADAQSNLYASGILITASLEAPIRHVSITADGTRVTSDFVLSADVLSAGIVKVCYSRTGEGEKLPFVNRKETRGG